MVKQRAKTDGTRPLTFDSDVTRMALECNDCHSVPRDKSLIEIRPRAVFYNLYFCCGSTTFGEKEHDRTQPKPAYLHNEIVNKFTKQRK